jgi:DNA-binding PadR family transcriptional regulator
MYGELSMGRKDRAIRKFRKELRSGVYSYLILKFLKTGELHGYAIRKLLEELSCGKFVPSAGALYDILKSLQKQGLVESFWVMETRPRKCYRLTNLGEEVLVEAEKEVRLIGEILNKLEVKE